MVAVVCHKGANELRPENTVAAAQLCIDWGVEWVEVDVNTCASLSLSLGASARVRA